ncbi:hypothetical protein DXG01_016642 [Tephrocybe rancida]|nr:hypothetical protein DXG01_016642 [Tephrocybe rancida]
MRTTTSIANFLGVSRFVVRNQLLALGIAEAQQQPFVLSTAYSQTGNTGPNDGDDLLDPPLAEVFPEGHAPGASFDESDVQAQVGATWADLFTTLEMQYGLDINNPNHIWLLHYLFLNTINAQLDFFIQSWNHHRIQIRGGPNQSPADMFGFDMFVHGIQGSQVPPNETMSEEELEVHGMDWEDIWSEDVLQSLETNNPRDEPAESWINCTGPPERLNEI